MSRRRAPERGERRQLEAGDRVVLPDGRAARVVLARGAEAIVDHGHPGLAPDGKRYALARTALLVRS